MALAAGAGVVAYFKLGAIVKAAIETLGPSVTGTSVRVGSVSLSPFSGSGRIRGLFIGNPAGFKGESAFELRTVRAAVDLKSLRGERILIKEIVVEGPVITFEGGLGGSNLSRLQKNVESASPASPASKSGKSGGERKIEIGLFKVTGGKVNLRFTGLGDHRLSVALPDIELRGIGRKSGGVTPSRAAREMLSALTGSALDAAARALQQGGGSRLRDTTKRANKLLKGLFGK